MVRIKIVPNEKQQEAVNVSASSVKGAIGVAPRFERKLRSVELFVYFTDGRGTVDLEVRPGAQSITVRGPATLAESAALARFARSLVKR